MIRVLLIPLLQCIGCQASGCQLDLVASVCQILKGGQRLIICPLNVLIKTCLIWEREVIGFCSLVCVAVIVDCNVILAADYAL